MGKVRLRKQIRAEVELNAFSVTIARRPYACVVVFTWRDGMLWSDAGFSKANWPDWYSEKFGIEIARGRALDGIVRQITGERKRTERLLTTEDLYQVAKLRILENEQHAVAGVLGVVAEGADEADDVLFTEPLEGSSPMEKVVDVVRMTQALASHEASRMSPYDTPRTDPEVAPWLADVGPPASGRQDGGPAWTDTDTAPWLPPAGQLARSIEEAPLDQ